MVGENSRMREASWKRFINLIIFIYDNTTTEVRFEFISFCESFGFRLPDCVQTPLSTYLKKIIGFIQLQENQLFLVMVIWEKLLESIGIYDKSVLLMVMNEGLGAVGLALFTLVDGNLLIYNGEIPLYNSAGGAQIMREVEAVEAGLMEYKLDIIISVHPLMQHIPLWVLKWQSLQKKVVFVTVITDVNTCHCTR
ncbi:hypothetical protein C5167_023016 [Papaver somniferum]|uniref:Diacylglycerol glucosyltransferase N-terminal domain-containing protein n=1 Tax=Papaver somniferum TaxID=3469 RepID=A0A4Y7JNK2_PAPSO|nr:hypothetical protein C5167_023016 [Papaver somniferum]